MVSGCAASVVVAAAAATLAAAAVQTWQLHIKPMRTLGKVMAQRPSPMLSPDILSLLFHKL